MSTERLSQRLGTPVGVSIDPHAVAAEVPLSARSATRHIAVQLSAYLTNHVVNRVPSYGLRHIWYRRILGLKLGTGSCIQLGMRLWFHSRRQIRRHPSALGGGAIGAGTWINRGCTLDVRGGLSIGEQVSISPEVVILTADHDRDHPDFPIRYQAVTIEDHAWIGMRAMVLPGVRIGRGAVVGAGAVVTRDVEPFTVVAGVPARIVDHRAPTAADYVFDERPPLFE